MSKKKKIPPKTRFTKRQIIIMGIAGIVGMFIFIFAPNLVNYFKPQPSPTPTPVYIDPRIPTHIRVDRVELNMDIKAATVSANDWQIFDDAVSWLNTSGNLRGGNMVLYGHNTKSDFGKIVELGTEDTIIIANGKGETKTYQVIEAFQGTPYDTWTVTYQDDRLTMYTCSGWFDVNRYFVIAKPVE